MMASSDREVIFSLFLKFRFQKDRNLNGAVSDKISLKTEK